MDALHSVNSGAPTFCAEHCPSMRVPTLVVPLVTAGAKIAVTSRAGRCDDGTMAA